MHPRRTANISTQATLHIHLVLGTQSLPRSQLCYVYTSPHGGWPWGPRPLHSTFCFPAPLRSSFAPCRLRTNDSFVMPILRYCITDFSGTTDTALALGFSECHTAHLKALSPIKAMLSTATKLGLQPCLETYTPANVLELPILVLCPDQPRRPPDPNQAATYEWNKLFVNDAFYYHRTLGEFRRMLPPYRGARSRLINLLFQYLDTSTGYIAPPLIRLFDETTATTLTQSSLSFDPRQLFRPTLKSGIKLHDMTPKKFRQSQRIPFSDLPSWYPRASATKWKQFWQASWPHHAHTILWRTMHTKLPCRERLNRLHARAFIDSTSPLCDQTDTDRHFLWDCIKKRRVWHGTARRFLQQPVDFTYDHLLITSPSDLTVHDITHVSYQSIVACTILEIWRAHWRYVFDNEPFWPNRVVANTIRLLRRLEAEHKL